MKLIELDDKDRLILEVIGKDPDASQSEIAKLVGLSQPSVGSRIKRMKDREIIDHTYGIDLKNPGFYILKVDVKCRRPKELIKIFEGCPFFLNGFMVAGKLNLTILFVGEDFMSLGAIVDKHVRACTDVKDIDMGFIVRADKSTIIPMKFHIEPADEAPCKSDCEQCEYMASSACLGCPVTGHYKAKQR